MQSRFTVKGLTAEDKDVILAYELKEDEFKVNLYIIPKKSLKGEASELLQKNWINGENFEFPKDTKTVSPNLNAESILPDDIRSEEAGKIRVQQNEWAYQLLTSKLWESYLNELEELKKRAGELTNYDRQLFEDAKSFWGRVLEHRRERDISPERIDKIKDEVNSIFDKLKNHRKAENAEFDAASTRLRDELTAKLEFIKKQMEERKGGFKTLFDEFRNLQLESKKNRYTKADEHTLRKAFNATFLFLTERRKHFENDKTAIRVKGLNEVIQKLETSLARDKWDLDYFARKADSSHIKSLELQLIKVKSNMLNETIASKEEKLKGIRATLADVLKQAERINKHSAKKEKEESKETPVEAKEVSPPDNPETAMGE